MTAKQKLLPKPCPICKRKNGTFQLVVFLDSFHEMRDIVCRVRHYDSKKYKQEKQTMSQNKRNYIPVKSPRRGQFWHSFRVSGLESGIDIFKYYTKSEINMRYNLSHNAKSWAFSLSPKLFTKIKNDGWNPLPDHSWKYKGRPRKDS